MCCTGAVFRDSHTVTYLFFAWSWRGHPETLFSLGLCPVHKAVGRKRRETDEATPSDFTSDNRKILEIRHKNTTKAMRVRNDASDSLTENALDAPAVTMTTCAIMCDSKMAALCEQKQTGDFQMMTWIFILKDLSWENQSDAFWAQEEMTERES